MNAEAEKYLKKTEFNFMVDMKALLHKTNVNAKLQRLNIKMRNNQEESAAEIFSPFAAKKFSVDRMLRFITCGRQI